MVCALCTTCMPTFLLRVATTCFGGSLPAICHPLLARIELVQKALHFRLLLYTNQHQHHTSQPATLCLHRFICAQDSTFHLRLLPFHRFYLSIFIDTLARQ
ncbi:hypothetical protein F5Y07DRAFT_139404 [Xylaria sp. FL0933]|nr:hypothetical protein F5Y07DRAFT_139404 [Xylaria sp. FL0933]